MKTLILFLHIKHLLMSIGDNKIHLLFTWINNITHRIQYALLNETYWQMLVILLVFIIIAISLIVYFSFKKERNKIKKEELFLHDKADVIHKKEQDLTRQIMHNLQIMNMVGNVRSRSFNNKEAWDEFYNTLDSIYPAFVEKLTTSFPILTEKDILLCCLEKAQFTTGEIAFILQIQPSTIYMRRTAIRKKVGIDKSQSLSDFFEQNLS